MSIVLDSVLLSDSDPLDLFRAHDSKSSDATLRRDITTKAGQMILFN